MSVPPPDLYATPLAPGAVPHAQTVLVVTVCAWLTWYVPFPKGIDPVSVLVNCVTIRVPARILVPVIVWPSANVPEVTAVTVKTFVAIDPVTTAAGAPVDRVSTGPDAVIGVEATEAAETVPDESLGDTAYLPTPPENSDEPSAFWLTMVVGVEMPVSVCPGTSLPEATAETVRTELAIVPVSEVGGTLTA